MPADKVTLKIPRPLYDQLRKIVEGTGFSSVNEFVVYVLRDLTSSGKPMPTKRPKSLPDPSGLTDEEIRIVKQRLHNLGYL
jgi:hypothetical protein